MNNWNGRGRRDGSPENWTRRPSERYDREDYYRNSNPDHIPTSDEENRWHFTGKFEDKNDPTYNYNYGTRDRDMMQEYPTYPMNEEDFYRRHPDRRLGTQSGYGDDTGYYGADGDFSSLSSRHYDRGYSRSKYGYGNQDRPLNLTQRSGDMARHMAGHNSDYGWRDGNTGGGGQRFGGSQNSSSFTDLNNHSNNFADHSFGHSYGQQSYAGRGPKGWKRSDESIKETVCHALGQHPRIDASEIEVEVKEGVVTLKGNIHDRPAKRLAEDVVEGLPGVDDIHNQLTVDKGFFQRAKELLTGESDIALDAQSKPGKPEKNPRH